MIGKPASEEANVDPLLIPNFEGRTNIKSTILPPYHCNKFWMRYKLGTRVHNLIYVNGYFSLSSSHYTDRKAFTRYLHPDNIALDLISLLCVNPGFPWNKEWKHHHPHQEKQSHS